MHELGIHHREHAEENPEAEERRYVFKGSFQLFRVFEPFLNGDAIKKSTPLMTSDAWFGKAGIFTHAVSMDEKDIYRAAQLLIDKHGNMASLRASERAVELGDAGDVEGVQTWGAILRAINELRSTESGGSVH